MCVLFTWNKEKGVITLGTVPIEIKALRTPISLHSADACLSKQDRLLLWPSIHKSNDNDNSRTCQRASAADIYISEDQN